MQICLAMCALPVKRGAVLGKGCDFQEMGPSSGSSIHPCYDTCPGIPQAHALTHMPQQIWVRNMVHQSGKRGCNCSEGRVGLLNNTSRLYSLPSITSPISANSPAPSAVACYILYSSSCTMHSANTKHFSSLRLQSEKLCWGETSKHPRNCYFW